LLPLTLIVPSRLLHTAGNTILLWENVKPSGTVFTEAQKQQMQLNRYAVMSENVFYFRV
jgi:hypothetical protein